MDTAHDAAPAGAVATELRADAARNRARVIEVARGQVDAGDLTLPMNTIAKLAGVGVGTVYRHFPTRPALLEAVAADAFDALLVEARVAAADPSAASALEHLLRSALRLLSTDQSFAAVLASPTCACVETMQRGEELGALIGQVLDGARRARLIRDDISSDDLRRLISGVEHALRVGPDVDGKFDLYLAVLLGGLELPRSDGD